MKKLIIAFLILGLAAPAAWGLYSTQQPARKIAPPPAVKQTQEAPPLLAPLDRLNDWAIALKLRIKASIYRE